jgi:hypothetical protein
MRAWTVLCSPGVAIGATPLFYSRYVDLFFKLEQ